MIISVIGQHLLISILPWLIGTVVGGGLGYACAIVARSVVSTHPGLRRAVMLLPWRTIAVTLTLVALLSPLTVEHFGLGLEAGQVSVGFFVFVFALPLGERSVPGGDGRAASARDGANL